MVILFLLNLLKYFNILSQKNKEYTEQDRKKLKKKKKLKKIKIKIKNSYNDVKTIFESAITAIDTHSPVDLKMDSIKFFLMEWITIDADKEFRVFVCEGKVTAISQQHLFTANKTIDSLGDKKNETIKKWANIIVNYCNFFIFYFYFLFFILFFIFYFLFYFLFFIFLFFFFKG